MKFCINFLIIVGITGSVYPILAWDPETETAIDKLIAETFLPTNHVPGLGLSILKNAGQNSEDRMVRGYGFSNLEDQVPTTGSTLFAIGSVTKSFVGILVVKVLSEKFPELGESALDVPIRKLFPAAANYTLIDRFRSESVTFRDLMSHRLCTNPDVFGIMMGQYKDKHEYMYRQRYAPELCSMRTRYKYNNGAVADASLLIALVAERTLEYLLNEFFLDLGMAETTVFLESVDYDSKPNMSRAYYRNGTTPMKFNSELLKRVCVAIGAGGILSSASDMLKFTSFNLRNGKVGERQVVSEEAMSWLRKPAISVDDMKWRSSESDVAIGDFAYGLGFFIGTQDGYECISHGGYLPPYASLFAYYPALNFGIFTTANGPGYLQRPMKLLHAQIFNILQYGPNATSVAPFNPPKITKSGFNKHTKESSPKSVVNNNKLEPRQLTGVYGNGLSGELAIFSSSVTDDLYIRYGRWGTGYLRPVTNTTYRVDWDSDLIQEEYTDGSVGTRIIDFTEPDKAKIVVKPGETVDFVKGDTLDKLPVQPWLPDSCSPTNLAHKY